MVWADKIFRPSGLILVHGYFGAEKIPTVKNGARGAHKIDPRDSNLIRGRMKFDPPTLSRPARDGQKLSDLW